MATDTGAEGKVDELKGKAQQTWGNVTGNEEDQAEGQGKEVKGHVKQAVGNVKDAVDDATDHP